jgi:hypothetical protein
MSNIFQIQKEYLQISEMLQENGGELTEEIEQLLLINESSLLTKSTGYCQVIKNLDSELLIIDSEIKRLQGLKDSRKKTIERLKESIANAMITFDKDVIETPLYKISFRASKSVQIFDENILPDNCKKIEIKPISKTEIKKMIDSGIKIPGARIVENKNLTIK